MSFSVGCRCGSDTTLLWFWRRPAAAALIQPLAWELPCTAPAPPHPQKDTNCCSKQRLEVCYDFMISFFLMRHHFCFLAVFNHLIKNNPPQKNLLMYLSLIHPSTVQQYHKTPLYLAEHSRWSVDYLSFFLFFFSFF